MPGWTWRKHFRLQQHTHLNTAFHDAFGLEHMIGLSAVWQVVVQ